MRELLPMGLKLLVITLVAGIFLGMADMLSTEHITANELQRAEAARAVLFDGASFEPIALPDGAPIDAAYYALSGGARVGLVLETTASGYNGGINLTIGVDTRERIITGIRVGAHAETPGLGDKAAHEPFYGQFAGMPMGALRLVKSAPGDMDIQAITAATVTSRAVTDAVNAAVEYAAERWAE